MKKPILRTSIDPECCTVPRLVTWDLAASCPDFALFLEDRETDKVTIVLNNGGIDEFDLYADQAGNIYSYDNYDYWTTYRCWDKRPSEKLRKEIEWRRWD